jgi:hypothetical protein
MTDKLVADFVNQFKTTKPLHPLQVPVAKPKTAVGNFTKPKRPLSGYLSFA